MQIRPYGIEVANLDDPHLYLSSVPSIVTIHFSTHNIFHLKTMVEVYQPRSSVSTWHQSEIENSW